MSNILSVNALSRRQVLMLGGFLSLSACASAVKDVNYKSDASWQVQINRVEKYLRTVNLNAVPFTQAWPKGTTGSGKLTYNPGYLDLVYQNPPGLTFKAQGLRGIYINDFEGSETPVNLEYNPLGVLMGDPIMLSGAVTVTDVRQSPGVLQISLARTGHLARGHVTLIFKDSDNELSLSDIHAADEHERTIEIHFPEQE